MLLFFILAHLLLFSPFPQQLHRHQQQQQQLNYISWLKKEIKIARSRFAFSKQQLSFARSLASTSRSFVLLSRGLQTPTPTQLVECVQLFNKFVCLFSLSFSNFFSLLLGPRSRISSRWLNLEGLGLPSMNERTREVESFYFSLLVWWPRLSEPPTKGNILPNDNCKLLLLQSEMLIWQTEHLARSLEIKPTRWRLLVSTCVVVLLFPTTGNTNLYLNQADV